MGGEGGGKGGSGIFALSHTLTVLRWARGRLIVPSPGTGEVGAFPIRSCHPDDFGSNQARIPGEESCPVVLEAQGSHSSETPSSTPLLPEASVHPLIHSTSLPS